MLNERNEHKVKNFLELHNLDVDWCIRQNLKKYFTIILNNLWNVYKKYRNGSDI